MATLGQQTSAVTAPATSTVSATLVAASGARRTRYVFNDSAGILYVRLGSGAASTTDFSFKLAAGTGTVIEGYGGQVTGVLDTGTGAARVTEW